MTTKKKVAKKRTQRAPEHYVNNKEFSQAVMDYVNEANKAKEEKREVPIVTDYIGRCFLRIAEGLSHKPNFIGYTYREEMVMDGVEDCIKRIMNYNIEVATRTGTPNAFAYFTQMCFFAFLRRIAKEKKQQDIRMAYIEHAGIDDVMSEFEGSSDKAMRGIEQGVINTIKNRLDKVHKKDDAIKEFKKKKKEDKGGLTTFM